MAWNSDPVVRALGEFAKSQKIKSTIAICMIGDGKFSVVSYGETSALCKKAKKVNDQIYNMVIDGDIDIPDELTD